MGEAQAEVPRSSIQPTAEAADISLSSNVDPKSAMTWNVRSLGLRSAADYASAASAGALVAPVITMIDRAIIENASGRATLGASLKSSLRTLLTRPHTFLLTRPFFLIFSLYSGTYMTANTLDTVSSTLRNQPATTVTSGAPKFVATSSANLALCLYKDSQFTRMFGTPGQAPRAVPLPTYALFTVRDCLTIFASFNLPPVLAPRLAASLDAAAASGSALAARVRKHVEAASVAQFVAPAAMQLFSTPLHLLGLDLYNRPQAPWTERLAKVRREWGVSCLARMGRIVPAFGVGGVVNMRVRRSLMERLEE